MNLRIKTKEGMTLVELLVGVALFGIVSVGGIWLMTEKKKEEINGNIQVLAAEMAEQFFKSRRDVFATSYEDLAGNGGCLGLVGNPATSLGLPNQDCTLEFPTVTYPLGIVPLVNPTSPFSDNDCQPNELPPLEFPGNTFRSVSIPSSGCFGSFRETITNVCDVQAPNNFGDLNFSGLTQCERNLIRSCAHEACGGVPESYFQMRVRVDRLTGPTPGGPPGGLSTTTFPANNQQGVIGAALCMIPNGPITPRLVDGGAGNLIPNPAGTYTGINFRLLFVVKDANNRLKLVRKETSFARPRLRQADSIIPAAIGCDKSQN